MPVYEWEGGGVSHNQCQVSECVCQCVCVCGGGGRVCVCVCACARARVSMSVCVPARACGVCRPNCVSVHQSVSVAGRSVTDSVTGLSRRCAVQLRVF